MRDDLISSPTIPEIKLIKVLRLSVVLKLSEAGIQIRTRPLSGLGENVNI